MIEASCHCGAVRIKLAAAPTQLTACNCSLCRRLGVLWAYYTSDEVTVEGAAGATVAYIQGRRTLEMHHCAACGCITHWRGLGRESRRAQIGVNARLMPPEIAEQTRIRHLDGASSWKYLD